MTQRNRPVDDDALPVMVPRSDRRLVPTPPARVKRLREHLAGLLVAVDNRTPAAPVRSEPVGFAAEVVRTACTMCRGWCCRNGDDDAFLDTRTIAHAQHARPSRDPAAVLDLYLGRVPPEVHEGSCIFHGKQGCTLDRDMRSDVCNAYFCGGLQAWLGGEDRISPTVVIAGEGKAIHTSRVLTPKDRDGRLQQVEPQPPAPRRL